MTPKSLYSRIALVFAAVLLGFGATLGWVAYATAKHQQHDILQRLSRGLADHIARHEPLIDTNGIDRKAVEDVFHMAMAVNPLIEVYLLDADGTVLAYSPADGRLARKHVALAPIQAFLDGQSLPIVGDDPRNAAREEVFSVTPIRHDGRTTGYLYIVLLGDRYSQLADNARRQYLWQTAAAIGAAALALALLVGLIAFGRITRPLDRLTHSVTEFENGDDAPRTTTPRDTTDEIGRLALAFDHMRQRLAAQMTELKRQDGLRRELVANVSHDLRTPLTSMQNYLETLARIGDNLSATERRQYLDVAVRHSHRVAKLSQQLFELARLECEETLPRPEIFSLPELMQDIAQKFSLTAADKDVRLTAATHPQNLFVRGDIGMIERVITNLIDNAIRHTDAGGEIRLETTPSDAGVEVRVADTGIGIAAEYLPDLFERGSPLRQTPSRRNGGLGLLIANRILMLHGARMTVASTPGLGTTFSFALPAQS
ncbi:MAG: HAMP domain-containing protein [Gammaproteobacteria bacterium]|nr:HAMP domain-containing protein [Gammaproteobacteria bacterium]